MNEQTVNLIIQELAKREQCSIEVNKLASGKYSWSVKQYHSGGDENEALIRLLRTENRLRDAFGEGAADPDQILTELMAASLRKTMQQPELLAACKDALIALDVDHGHHKQCQYCEQATGHTASCPVPNLERAVANAEATNGQ